MNKGWSTWCTENDILPCYDDFCNEQEIRSVADAMAANGLKDLGYNYIVLDDCCAPLQLLPIFPSERRFVWIVIGAAVVIG